MANSLKEWIKSSIMTNTTRENPGVQLLEIVRAPQKDDEPWHVIFSDKFSYAPGFITPDACAAFFTPQERKKGFNSFRGGILLLGDYYFQPSKAGDEMVIIVQKVDSRGGEGSNTHGDPVELKRDKDVQKKIATYPRHPDPRSPLKAKARVNDWLNTHYDHQQAGRQQYQILPSQIPLLMQIPPDQKAKLDLIWAKSEDDILSPGLSQQHGGAQQIVQSSSQRTNRSQQRVMEPEVMLANSDDEVEPPPHDSRGSFQSVAPLEPQEDSSPIPPGQRTPSTKKTPKRGEKRRHEEDEERPFMMSPMFDGAGTQSSQGYDGSQPRVVVARDMQVVDREKTPARPVKRRRMRAATQAEGVRDDMGDSEDEEASQPMDVRGGTQEQEQQEEEDRRSLADHREGRPNPISEAIAERALAEAAARQAAPAVGRRLRKAAPVVQQDTQPDLLQAMSRKRRTSESPPPWPAYTTQVMDVSQAPPRAASGAQAPAQDMDMPDVVLDEDGEARPAEEVMEEDEEPADEAMSQASSLPPPPPPPPRVYDKPFGPLSWIPKDAIPKRH